MPSLFFKSNQRVYVGNSRTHSLTIIEEGFSYGIARQALFVRDEV